MKQYKKPGMEVIDLTRKNTILTSDCQFDDCGCFSIKYCSEGAHDDCPCYAGEDTCPGYHVK